MKSKMIVADYDHTPMSFREDGWFNATVAAERFGKEPRDWLRLHETEEYMRALAEHMGIAFEPSYAKRKNSGKVSGGKSGFRPELNKIKGLVLAKRGSPETGGGTWLHPRLAAA